MAEGITYLVDILNSGFDEKQDINPMQFVDAIKEGMQIEPEKFPQLIEAYEARIQKTFPNWSQDKVRQKALGHISGYACLADHDLKIEMLVRAETGEPRSRLEWYDNPEGYGLAMNAFANYIGDSGVALRKFILD